MRVEFCQYPMSRSGVGSTGAGFFYAFNRVEFDPFNMVEIDQFTFSCVLPRGYASRGHVLFAAGKGPFVRPLY